MKIRNYVAQVAALVLVFALSTSAASAQQVPPHQFKVLGSFANLPPYLEYEQPFWTKSLSEVSRGSLTADIRPHTEVGLKGFEILRLLNLGVFDFGHIVIGYVASDDPVLEGLDLTALTQDFKKQREISDRYKPVIAAALEKKHGVKLLALAPYPSQMFFCRSEVKSLADLKGKKIRVYSTTLGDFVEGVGGVSVTIAFPEVVPALEKGTIDCGIGGASTAYAGKWFQVTESLYAMRVGYGMSMLVGNLKMWNKLDQPTRALLEAEFRTFEERIWTGIEREDLAGLACNVGKPCSLGPPAKLKLFEPSAEDLKQRDRILQQFVLKRWAQRCGAACAEDWNRTIGDVLKVTAQP